MDEQKRNNVIEEAASALIKNAEADSVSLGEKREQKNGNGSLTRTRSAMSMKTASIRAMTSTLPTAWPRIWVSR